MAPVQATIVSGAGRWSDPWHPFRDTSQRLADVVGGVGLDVRVDEAVDARLSDLGTTDLLVVNAGNPRDPDPADHAVRAGLLAHVGRGRPILAVHACATSFPHLPEWEGILGGAWVRGTTYHSDYGPGLVHVRPDAALEVGVEDFTVQDELYTDLRVHPGVDVLAYHHRDGVDQPLAWTWQGAGCRVVYDALGHDTASYDAPAHCELVRRAVRWLLEA